MSAQAQTTASLSTAQLGELALDAAIEVEDAIAGRAYKLGQTKQLMGSLLATLSSEPDVPCDHKLDLAYLPIYESALEVASESFPPKVDDFRRQVQEILDKFISAEASDGKDALVKLRDFCLSVHEEALSQRVEVARSSRPYSSYAGRPF